MKKIVLILSAWILILSLTGFLAVPGASAQLSPQEYQQFRKDAYKSHQILWEIQALIKAYYYKDIVPDECYKQILKSGLGACLDRNSYFITAEELQQAQMEKTGHFGGIGIQIGIKKNMVVVMSVNENGPAFKAGLKRGDTFLKINGKDVTNATLYEIVKLLRGQVGTAVEIEIGREGENKPRTFIIAREDIKIEYVKYSLLAPDIGYLKLSAFEGDDTYYDFFTALENLEKQLQGESKKLAIDLRDDPGGFLHLAEAMLSLFINNPDEILVTEVFRKGIERVDKVSNVTNYWKQIPPGYQPKKIFTTADIGRFKNFKIVILINSGSASASEIFSGKMKELGIPLVGEKTFTKGTVQTEFELSDNSVVHMTIAEYFVGNGRIKVNGIGVEPNYPVKNDEKDAGDPMDNPPNSGPDPTHDKQLQKAIELLSK